MEQRLEDSMPLIIKEVIAWIYQQRDLYSPAARHLEEEEKRQLKGYFKDRILDLTLIKTDQVLTNPPIYDMLAAQGIPVQGLDCSRFSAMTFINCVAVSHTFAKSQKPWRFLLFHEMVHVVQFDLLGTEKFIEQCLSGYVKNNFSYRDIPLEKTAYGLEARYKLDEQFTVHEEVAHQLQDV